MRNQHFNKRDQTTRRQELRAVSPPAERMLWRHLRGKATGVKFRRQFSVDPYFLDFYCASLHLAIEIDGTSHQTDEAVAYDIARQHYIEAQGICFLRFTNEQIFHNMIGVMETLLGTIDQRRAEMANEKLDTSP